MTAGSRQAPQRGDEHQQDASERDEGRVLGDAPGGAGHTAPLPAEGGEGGGAHQNGTSSSSRFTGSNAETEVVLVWAASFANLTTRSIRKS